MENEWIFAKYNGEKLVSIYHTNCLQNNNTLGVYPAGYVWGTNHVGVMALGRNGRMCKTCKKIPPKHVLFQWHLLTGGKL